MSTAAANKPVDVVLGALWGDEGKGKIVDFRAADYDIVARCQGGNNAGHTVIHEGVMYDFHLVPSGLLNPKSTVLIGNGVVIHLIQFFAELDKLASKGVNWKSRVLVSDRAHIVFDYHQKIDVLEEKERGNRSLGTTGKGIGPAYKSKVGREGLRVAELLNFPDFIIKFSELAETAKKRFPDLQHNFHEELSKLYMIFDRLKYMVVDSVQFLRDAIKENKKILVEGANAAMLDIEFGSYPCVTSSSCTIGGVMTGLGIPPKFIGETIGVVKAYTTRVGEGPFPTELQTDTGDGFTMQRTGKEVGVTTGRMRRCGWLDCVVLNYTSFINGFTALNVTKLDVLDEMDEVKIAVSYEFNGRVLTSVPAGVYYMSRVVVNYKTLPGWKRSIKNVRTFEELPVEAQNYIKAIEEAVGVPVKWIGVGPDRKDMICL